MNGKVQGVGYQKHSTGVCVSDAIRTQRFMVVLHVSRSQEQTHMQQQPSMILTLPQAGSHSMEIALYLLTYIS
jgi:hypothetical protein